MLGTVRYAIVSDIHANRPAWEAVLIDLRAQGVDEIICLGDVVGYGPSPAEVLESLYANVHHFVLGNHDAALCGVIDAAAFNDGARRLLDWTQGQLDAKARAFLHRLPLVIKGAGFRCAHAELARPGRFGYIIDPDDALPSWAACNEQLLFVGHTHDPAIFVVGGSGRPHRLDPCDFSLEEGKRYIVNVGAVGQPRDDDPRAGYAIVDDQVGNVLFRRVPFDIEGYRRDVTRAGIGIAGSYFLSVADAMRSPPIREALDFHPNDAIRAQHDVPVKTLQQAVGAARRWRRLGVSAVTALLLVVTGLTLAAVVLRPKGRVYEARVDCIEALPSPGRELLAEPAARGAVSAENRLRLWSVSVSDAGRQHVFVRELAAEERGGACSCAFRVESRTLAPVVLASPRIRAAAGTRFTARAQFDLSALTDGYVEMAIVEVLGDRTERLLANRQPKASPQASGWLRPNSVTMAEGLPRDTQVRYLIRGEFTGEVQVRGGSFFRRE